MNVSKISHQQVWMALYRTFLGVLAVGGILGVSAIAAMTSLAGFVFASIGIAVLGAGVTVARTLRSRGERSTFDFQLWLFVSLAVAANFMFLRSLGQYFCLCVILTALYLASRLVVRSAPEPSQV